MKKGIMFMVMALLFFAATQVHATAEGAKAAFMKGLAKEKAKDYQGAITDYQAALQEYPGYIYANKQMGNCYYYMGDKAQALKNYDAYLAVKKDDATTKAFADKMRPAGDSAAQGAEGSSEGSKVKINPSFYLGPTLSYMMIGGDDLITGISGATVSTVAFAGGLNLGYQLDNGFFVGGGYELLARVSTVGFSASGFSGAAAIDVISESVFFVEPGYRFPLSRKIALLGGLKLGYASDSLTFGSSSSSSVAAVAITGSGLMYEPEAGIQFILGHRVGLNLNLGYRIDSVTPSAVGGVAISSSGSAPAFSIVNSGMQLSLGLNIYFHRLID